MACRGISRQTGCRELLLKRLDGERTVGVQIADRIVTFSKDSEQLSGRFRVNVSGNGNMKFVITDLKPGNWQVKKDGEIFIPGIEVRSDDGVLSFEGTAGIYEFCR